MSADERPAPCGFELGRRYHSSTCERLCQRAEGHAAVVHRCACGVTVPVKGSQCRHVRTTTAMIGMNTVTVCGACGMRMDVFPGDPEDDALDGLLAPARREPDAWDELYSSGEVPPETSMPTGTPAVDPQTERRERLLQAIEYVRSMRPFELPDNAVVSLPVSHVRALLEEVHDQRRDMATVDGHLKAASERTHAPRPLGEYR